MTHPRGARVLSFRFGLGGKDPNNVRVLRGYDSVYRLVRKSCCFPCNPSLCRLRAGWCINRNEECSMRKLLFAALLGVSLLPIVPPIEAQVIVMRPHPVHRGRYFHGGRWWGHRQWRGNRWRYW
jgi:hypothetical protein